LICTENQLRRKAMPVILLWLGIPVLLIGSGFVIYRVIGG
jgi:hypothetical protein